LVDAFSRTGDAGDALELSELLADRQKVFLLLFEEKRAVVQTLGEITLTELLPFGDLVGLLLLQLLKVRLQALGEIFDQFDGLPGDNTAHFLLGNGRLV